MKAKATTWYASATGSGTNGTSAQPWHVTYATTNANTQVQPGDTVLIKDGTFVCTNWASGLVSYTNALPIMVSGTPASPITFQSENLWGAKFNGGLVGYFGTHDLILKGLYVYTDSNGSRTSADDWHTQSGIMLHGTNQSILHCIVENFGQPGIGAWKKGPYEISGNIVRFTGVDQTGGSVISVRGSGLYLENYHPTNATVKGNIVYWCATDGIKPKTDMVGFDIEGNFVYGAVQNGIEGVPNNIPPSAMTIRSNLVWAWGAAGWVSVGMDLHYPENDTFNSTNLLVEGNYVVAGLKGIHLRDQLKEVWMTNNTVAQLGYYGDGASAFATEYGVVWLADDYAVTNSPSYDIDRNWYWNTNASSTDRFSYDSTPNTFAEWQANGFDGASSYYQGLPTNEVVYVTQPTDDANLLYIGVANWPTNASTTVDVSAYFTVGKTLFIYDAQNIPTSYTNFSYTGGSIPLALDLTDYAAMDGTLPGQTNEWAGFDPRFRAFVVYAQAPTNSTMNIGALNVNP